jgi:hypothetical protein
MTYNNTIWMIAFMHAKFFSSTKASGAYVYAIALFADFGGTFDSDGMREVAGATIA